MKTFIKSLFLPSVDGIMSTFNSTIKALELNADVNSNLAYELRNKAVTAQTESDRATKLAIKLKAAFTI